MAFESAPARSLTVVIAPDSFKGTIAAPDAAAAIAAGWHAARPGDGVILKPMADGGEGTLAALATGRSDASWRSCVVTGPASTPVPASWLMLDSGTAIVELAQTSGITLMPTLDPLHATSLGFGQAVAAALDAGARQLVLCVGGSASTDGGAGLLVGLGARILDAAGVAVAASNAGIGQAMSIELSRLRPLPPGGAVVLCDVMNPLLGPDGSAAVFGPQKGAVAAQLDRLEQNLAHWAALLDRPDCRDAAGSGAAGGVGFGALVWGAQLRSGAASVAAAIGLPEALADADVVITGEGRYDGQSRFGKVVSAVGDAAVKAGTAVALIAGEIEQAEPATLLSDGFAWAGALTDGVGGVRRALVEPAAALTEIAHRCAQEQTSSDWAKPRRRG